MDEEEQLLQEHQAMQAADDEWWEALDADEDWIQEYTDDL
jgi:hypothetical protein